MLFLEKGRQFRERGELKEFHRIVGSILGLRKASLSVHEIEDPHYPSQRYMSQVSGKDAFGEI